MEWLAAVLAYAFIFFAVAWLVGVFLRGGFPLHPVLKAFGFLALGCVVGILVIFGAS